MTKLKNDAWLKHPDLQHLLTLLEEDGHSARVVGGAVRNALLERSIDDIDIATSRHPKDTLDLLKDNKIKALPTGIDHGTITAVINEVPYEITTLRADEDHDGRHAKVKFGEDWAGDAKRRDFTINAIYVDRHSELFDPENGLEDIKTKTLRFIGDPDKRIHEDHLRILRFFRIYAHYGDGQPDPEALKACARAKDSINELSSERIWSELKKLMKAQDISKALNWMRVTKVLNVVLPESEKWGIGAIPHLMEAEQRYGWEIDPFIRIMAIIPPRHERINTLIERLKLSNAEKKRFEAWVHMQGLPFEEDEKALAKTLYQNEVSALLDYYRLEVIRQMNAGEGNEDSFAKRVEFINAWQRPEFPIAGKDLIERGQKPGAALGETLKRLEAHWIDHDFAPSKDELLALL